MPLYEDKFHRLSTSTLKDPELSPTRRYHRVPPTAAAISSASSPPLLSLQGCGGYADGYGQLQKPKSSGDGAVQRIQLTPAGPTHQGFKAGRRQCHCECNWPCPSPGHSLLLQKIKKRSSPQNGDRSARIYPRRNLRLLRRNLLSVLAARIIQCNRLLAAGPSCRYGPLFSLPFLHRFHLTLNSFPADGLYSAMNSTFFACSSSSAFSEAVFCWIS